MFRFSIRELMLVTLAVGLAVGWLVDRRMMAVRLDDLDARLAPIESQFNFERQLHQTQIDIQMGRVNAP